jgi:hypothetical protein
MGYYAAGDFYGKGDWYAAGDPGVAALAVRGGTALAKRFMPGVGAALVGAGAVRAAGKALGKTHALKHLRRALGRKIGGFKHHRRMNVCNPRALRRSLRRVKGFEHFARQVVRITSPKRRVSGFRFRRRKRK